MERSLFEAFSICFLTELDRDSYPIVLALIVDHICKKKKGMGKIKMPGQKGSVMVEGYWIETGGGESPNLQEDYILTETVRRNLKDIARIVGLCEYPILIQGETSVGKTSLIKYLADVTGNKVVRINNHEHTDVQEYIGSYSADESGAFAFNEGVLAQAMRDGHWIILDELNLASTEILEALNRVLDDNRELFIPENQTCIAAHKSFRLFATQNPAGSYGGRKTLSRAFRNRFVELHFDELASSELETIIEKKCQIPPKMSKMMIRVLKELQLKRRASAAFQGKKGFITLRDLFRWAFRYGRGRPSNIGEEGEKFYDWDLHMAEEGFLVLASRIRKEAEVQTVREAIEKFFKKKIDEAAIFSLEKPSLVLKPEMQLLKQERNLPNQNLKSYNEIIPTFCLCAQFDKIMETICNNKYGKCSNRSNSPIAQQSYFYQTVYKFGKKIEIKFGECRVRSRRLRTTRLGWCGRFRPFEWPLSCCTASSFASPSFSLERLDAERRAYARPSRNRCSSRRWSRSTAT